MNPLEYRRSGILLHPTSLPGRFGIGDLGPGADMFLDWARDAGQSVWQILPLGPTGPGGSPYGSHSAFAGNAMLISPDLLMREGWIPEDSLDHIPRFSEQEIDFDRVEPWKRALLRLSWEHFQRHARAGHRFELESFVYGVDQSEWLDDWALYMALKGHHGGAEWLRWDRDLASRDRDALVRARHELHSEVAFEKYIQFLFFRQWRRVHDEARQRDIAIVGDLPIYVALDSADVWANPECFQLDEELQPTSVAGVPPDYFSKTGQRWGNPLYRWDRMAEDGYEWWMSRLRANFRLADIVRIDHFRAFADYWEIPVDEETAVKGQWVPGPGIDFFRAVRRQLGEVPLIAEDLGDITPDVDELRELSGLPGMKVLQFAFHDDKNAHLPERHRSHSVVYTGTHDNDTSAGWYEKAEGPERSRVVRHLGGDDTPIAWRMIRAAFHSLANLAIVPMQDVLGLGSEARMNVPGDRENNWAWRATPLQFRGEEAMLLRKLGEKSGRLVESSPRLA